MALQQPDGLVAASEVLDMLFDGDGILKPEHKAPVNSTTMPALSLVCISANNVNIDIIVIYKSF